MIISQRKVEKISLGLLVIAVVISPSLCCENLEWSCGTGECLAVELLCDGTTDCPDGSDETADACIQQVCPQFTFRCAYGACVSNTARCNGISECADGSDEARVLCKPDETRENTICFKDEFQCNSGQCISQDDACDGKANCSDQSDESVETCASTTCPSLFFRCGYGACISAEHKCDGVSNCLDGSDETFNLCGVKPPPKPTSTARIPVVTPTPKPTPTSPPRTNKATCTAPNIKNSLLALEATPSLTIRPGEEVPNLNSIVYQCEAGFYREGPTFNLCFNGAWFSAVHPICTRYCPHEVLKGVTFNAKCIRDGATVSCNDHIKPGTVAKISCPNKYRIPAHNPTQTLFCDEDGQWDYPPSRCEPICGEETVPSVPFLVNGIVTNITAVPWHVGIYRKFSDRYNHHCGGTLISAKIVISAAHCFWDYANEGIYDKSLYSIGAGKYFRDYYMDESRKGQFQNISQIAIPPDYKDRDNNFKADIAVLVLTNALQLSEFVAPACIDWKKDGAKSMPNRAYGQVAGWGKDESGDYSSELRTILIPGSSYEVCRNKAGPHLADSITGDKFCVINEFNTNACQGDSGGGFAMKKEIGGKNRYYLWGVVSTGVPIGVTCSNYQFVSYTNIQYYENFITDLETRNRPK